MFVKVITLQPTVKKIITHHKNKEWSSLKRSKTKNATNTYRFDTKTKVGPKKERKYSNIRKGSKYSKGRKVVITDILLLVYTVKSTNFITQVPPINTNTALCFQQHNHILY